MNPETFDNDNPNASNEDYTAFVAWLSERTVAELKAAKSNTEAQKTALCRYYKRGLNANLTPSELIDFLAVDAPSILDSARYTLLQAEALMELSDKLTDEDIKGAVLE